MKSTMPTRRLKQPEAMILFDVIVGAMCLGGYELLRLSAFINAILAV